MRLKTVMLATGFCAVSVLLCCVALICGTGGEASNVFEKTNKYWDARPPVTLTPEEQEKADWFDKLDSPVPIIACGLELYTFGQASKFCDWAVVGTVEDVTYAMGTGTPTKGTPLDVAIAGQRLALSVDVCLYGKPTGKKMTFMLMGDDEEDSVFPVNIEKRKSKTGDRILAFLTDKWYGRIHLLNEWPSPDNILFFHFDKSTTKWEKTDIYILSHIILDGKGTEEEAIRAAKGYLSFFGGDGRRDRDGYYEFLCSLLSSPVKRIRNDAESDLVLFHTKEKDPPPDLDKLLADGRVRKEVKDYLRYLLRDERPTE